MNSPNRQPSERVAAATDEAFWAALAAALPEVTSGDLTPAEATAWEQARDAAVSAWLVNNAPGTDGA